jgi:5-(carboxyamino)imidazole ribonucleotide synthase
MRLGVLGGGQLARMLAIAGHPLGVTCTVLDPSPDACAGPVAELIVAAYDDPAALDRLAAASDVVTFEFENPPAASAQRLAGAVQVHPPPGALEVAQDRLLEKQLFERLGVPTPAFQALGSQADVDQLETLPVVLKTRRMGYDGKGQLVVRERQALAGAFDALGGVPLIAEELVGFDRELSVIAVRGTDGTTAAYPLVENHHRDGILRLTRAPADGVGAELQRAAGQAVGGIAEKLDYVGVLALELFQVGDRLLANEIAPRVHNSGHWTIEGAVASQFENHLRAVLGLPLGSTAARGPSGMVNLIGEPPAVEDVLAVPAAHLHLYGKAPRPGRKIGHVTVTGRDQLDARLGRVAALASNG